MNKDDLKKQLDINAILNKKYGAGSFLDLSKKDQIPEQEYVVTDMPSLNRLLGKGIPRGRVIEIFGLESSGKTTLALYMLKHVQKATKKKIAYIDLENAVDWERAKELGVDLNTVFCSRPKTGEQALDIVEKLCQSELVGAIVIDSVAQLVPSAVAAKEIDGSANIATSARLLSQTLPRLSNAASASNTTLIFINQLRMNIGVTYGNPEVTTGGMALKYAASIRLRISSRKPKDEDKITGGIFVNIRAIKNKLTTPNFSREVFLDFKKGFDEVRDTLTIALEIGLIEQKGTWFQYGSLKAQGWESFIEEVKKVDGLYDKILGLLKSMK